jgi:phosphopentomutase
MTSVSHIAPHGRIVFVVLDSVGVGELPDAPAFGDGGSDTLGHIDQAVGLSLPNLAQLGLGNIRPLAGVPPVANPRAAFGKMVELSQGKDTATGHWEMCGVVTQEGFATFPDGFPQEMLDAFCHAIGVEGVLGNRPASGTVIIEDLGREHQRTGWPIVYTSADPVFQIAAHEEIISVSELYSWCEAAYQICEPAGLGRVIARPFVGTWPNYTRTYNRKDYAVPPPRPTLLEGLVKGGVPVIGVGKIPSIFSHRGISIDVHTHGNDHGMEVTTRLVADGEPGFIFTNLVDFDALYGHRRDPQGYADCLAAFDRQLPALLDALGAGDVLILSADHGNDPTYRGTDHTREYVPLLVVGENVRRGVDLGVRATFADVGQTIAEFYGVPPLEVGTSFLREVL